MTLQTSFDSPATMDGLARLLVTFRTFLTSAGVAASIQRNVHAAIDELLANIVQHGRCDQPRHEITAIVTCDDSNIVVELVDNGLEFDPLSHDAAIPADLQVGGIGIRLARHWVDDMHYERRGTLNHITLKKSRRSRVPR